MAGRVTLVEADEAVSSCLREVDDTKLLKHTELIEDIPTLPRASRLTMRAKAHPGESDCACLVAAKPSPFPRWVPVPLHRSGDDITLGDHVVDLNLDVGKRVAIGRMKGLERRSGPRMCAPQPVDHAVRRHECIDWGHTTLVQISSNQRWMSPCSTATFDPPSPVSEPATLSRCGRCARRKERIWRTAREFVLWVPSTGTCSLRRSARASRLPWRPRTDVTGCRQAG